MMRRDECFEKIAELRDDAIVVSSYSSAFEWRGIAPSPLNFVSVGAMGQASSHALGLAIGLPDEKIIVLDGDGALLMNLQCLVTIAEAAPKNFLHFVNENGCYEANGSHPIPGQGKVDFAGMARSAGYAHVFEFDGMKQFTSELPGIMALEGPVFVTLKIEPAGELEYDYPYTHGAQAREDFKQAIAPMIAKRDAT